MVTEDSKIKQSVDDQYTPVNRRPAKQKSGALSGFIILLIFVGALGAGAWYFQDELRSTFAEGEQLASVEALENAAEEEISDSEENYFDAVRDTETIKQATELDKLPAETARMGTSPRAPGTYGKPTAPPVSKAVQGRPKNDLSYLENASVVDPQGRVAAYVNEISMDNNSAGTITMSLRRNESLSAESVPVVMTVKILNAVETEDGAYQIALTQEQNQALQTSMMTN